jgi:hypothetical protein
MGAQVSHSQHLIMPFGRFGGRSGFTLTSPQVSSAFLLGFGCASTLPRAPAADASPKRGATTAFARVWPLASGCSAFDVNVRLASSGFLEKALYEASLLHGGTKEVGVDVCRGAPDPQPSKLSQTFALVSMTRCLSSRSVFTSTSPDTRLPAPSPPSSSSSCWPCNTSLLALPSFRPGRQSSPTRAPPSP